MPSGRCAIGARFPAVRRVRHGPGRSERLSPNFARTRAAYTATCAGWPLPVANPTGQIPGDELPPLLGAAPLLLEDAAVHALTDQVPGSVVVRFPDTGHGLYVNEGNACVIAHADRYLIDGVLPPPGTTCP